MIIENLYLYLTWRCNLHCKHCWVSADAENLLNSCEIPDEKYKDIILEACNLGVNFIKISGGEPLLRWNALKIIIQTAVANGCEILLETNGTLLEQKIVDFLKAHNCVISISLDGEQSKHNDLRNSPTAFQQTDKGLKLLISNGIIPQIVYSFSEANDVEIDNMIETLTQTGIKELKLNPIMRVGRGECFQSKNSLQNVMTVSADELLRIKNKYCNNPKADLNVRIMLPVCFDGYSMLFNKDNVFISCPFDNLISILPNGNVGLCGEAKNIKEFNYGNIYENSLTTILSSSVNYKAIQKIESNLMGVCNSCVAKQLCKGSCRVIAYQYNNSIYSSNPLCEELHQLGKFPF